jgi:hypothetical protein
LRVLLNPCFLIETGELLYHDGESFVEQFPIRLDRSAQGQAQQNSNKANSVAGGFGTTAAQVGSSLIPGLERQANNPTGLTPEQKNNATVSGAEAIGGVNSGVKGEANLASSRTRNAGGMAPALDEAARIKGRQLATNVQGVTNLDTELANKKQEFAQGELGNIYGGLNKDQLTALGISDEDINTMIKAGQSGWQQNAMGWLNAFKPAGGGGGAGSGGGAAAG